MKQAVRLETLEPGTPFEIWGHEYTVLDTVDGGILCIENNVIDTVVFANDRVTNDFSKSDINIYLKTAYLSDLADNGADTGNIDADTLCFDVDLKCTLGQREYGAVSVKAGLLTLEQYGRYCKLFPIVTDSWWLATPYMTPEYSKSKADTSGAWTVNNEGNVNPALCEGVKGIRPVLALSPELMVSVEGESDIDSNDWREYIKYLHAWAVDNVDQPPEEKSPYTFSQWLTTPIRPVLEGLYETI